mgnify:CR=1 FL=1
MATLRFRYSPMNAGKSSNLLQVAYNYNERGMNVLLMKPSIDTKGFDRVVSRGMKDSRKVDFLLSPNINIYDLVVDYLKNNSKKYVNNNELLNLIKQFESDPNKINKIYNTFSDYLIEKNYDNKFDKILSAILIDEAQFLTEKQVKELSDITVILDIPVICFGLRTDFLGNLFPGSEALFRYANSLEELTTVCICGKKALHNARLINGKYVSSGSQVAIDEKDDVSYISLCPEHYREFVYGIKIDEERKKINKLVKKR